MYSIIVTRHCVPCLVPCSSSLEYYAASVDAPPISAAVNLHAEIAVPRRHIATSILVILLLEGGEAVGKPLAVLVLGVLKQPVRRCQSPQSATPKPSRRP